MKIQFTKQELINKFTKTKPASPEWGKLALDAIKLSLISDIDQLFIGSYSGKNYIRYPHQIYAASRVINAMNGRTILADEVGLGKTIEAGLVLGELFARKLIEKVLIIVPASLASQWQYQMFDIFDFKFINASWTKSEIRDDVWDFYNSKFAGFTEHPLIITSYEKAKSHAGEIKRVKWDLVICDEAHRMRNRKYTFGLVNELEPRYLLLLTATPIHNKLEDFYNQASLVRPGFFGTLAHFKRQFYADSSGRKLKNKDDFDAKKIEIMIRQRAAEVNIRLPERKVFSLISTASKAEQSFHQAVAQYIRRQAEIIRKYAPDEKTRHAQTFELIHLSMRSNSSPKAILVTLDRKLEKAKTLGSEIEKELRKLRSLAKKIKHPSKTEEHLKQILTDHKGDKILIFTIYGDTQEYLASVLKQSRIKFLPFGGYMKSKDRSATVKEFNDNPKVQILLSTDAASEGLNLQYTCHTVVNFDLPWNPMRMEQRIGRLHRIGQKHQVLVYNLAVRGSIDERIVKRLYEKIGITKKAIGDIQTILTELEERTNIEEEILLTVASAKTPERLDFGQIDQNIELAQKAAEAEKAFSEKVFDRFEEK